MQLIVNSEQMKELDHFTIEKMGIPSLVLMERAALSVTEELKKGYSLNKVLILCGSGNNGADGVAIGRILHLQGYQVHLYLAGKKEAFSKESKIQWEIASNYHVPIVNKIDFREYTTIVDAIFGVGLSREIQGSYYALIEAVNQSQIPVAAVDIPSGINGTSGKMMGIAIKAQKTITFAYGKIGLYLYPGAEYAGEVVVKDIGIYGKKEGFYTLEESDMHLIPKRISKGNKGTFGKVLIVAGSKNMCGAAYLAAKSCMMMGTGMVKILTEESNRIPLQQLFPEAMLTTYRSGAQQEEILKLLKEASCWATVIADGPGLGNSREAGWMIEYLWKEKTEKPLILDADGINYVSRYKALWKHLKRPCVLTPHMGEMARLSGFSIEELKENPIASLKQIAEEFISVLCEDAFVPDIVMKDARTLIWTGDKKGFININGNSGMATAGSGDVLAGMISGLAAIGMDTHMAAPMGVWLHAKAGDIAREKKGEASMIASDMIEAIPQVIR